jgi:hypothetical protein
MESRKIKKALSSCSTHWQYALLEQSRQAHSEPCESERYSCCYDWFMIDIIPTTLNG